MEIEDINWPEEIFITGIGTDVGKSYATGWLARELNDNGISCITQKMIQTGNVDMSEDIERHRKIMETGLLAVDLCHITAPVIFSYPASPHLAARIDGKEIDLSVISAATDVLKKQYERVLIEGAGGLMVPLSGEYLTADYIRANQIPTIVVVTGQLGSINHALLTFNAIRSYVIELLGVIYNPFFDKDKTICADTREYLQEWLRNNFPESFWMEMPVV